MCKGSNQLQLSFHHQPCTHFTDEELKQRANNQRLLCNLGQQLSAGSVPAPNSCWDETASPVPATHQQSYKYCDLQRKARPLRQDILCTVFSTAALQTVRCCLRGLPGAVVLAVAWATVRTKIRSRVFSTLITTFSSLPISA